MYYIVSDRRVMFLGKFSTAPTKQVRMTSKPLKTGMKHPSARNPGVYL
jgi:hypothetical protein